MAIFNRGFAIQLSGLDLATANLRLMLVKDDYTFNAAHNHVSDLSANAISVDGYTIQELDNRAVNEDDALGFAYLYADGVTFPNLAAGQNVGGAVLYVSTGSNATSQVISHYTITPTPTNGGDISIAWAANTAGSVLKLGPAV